MARVNLRTVKFLAVTTTRRLHSYEERYTTVSRVSASGNTADSAYICQLESLSPNLSPLFGDNYADSLRISRVLGGLQCAIASYERNRVKYTAPLIEVWA